MIDLRGERFGIADGRRLTVSGIVVNRECTVNGYRITLDRLSFLQAEHASPLMESVVRSLNRSLSDRDRMQVHLPDAQDHNELMYGTQKEDGLWENAAGEADQTPLFESLRIGERIILHGKCTQPECAANPGQFDNRRYCIARRIVLKMSEAGLKGKESPSFSPYDQFRNVLADLRIGMQRGLADVFGREDAAQIAAFVLGDGSGMDSGKKQLFRDGGLSWLVCVSSLHISLIGMTVYRFLRGRRLPFAAAGAAAFVLALCYVFLTGFSVSSQRALAVFLIWLGAQVFGRTQDSLSALSVAAVWILFRQPAALWDSSFVLSCVCILSSEYVTPAFSRILRPRFSWHRSLAGSFSLYIGSLPAVLWFFYQTTPYTFLMYPVMVVLVMLTLCFSLAGSMLGYLFFQTGQAMFLGAAKVFAWPGRVLLAVLRYACMAERKLPFSVLILGRPGLWQVLAYYGIVCAFVMVIARMDAIHFSRRFQTAEPVPSPRHHVRLPSLSPLVKIRVIFGVLLCFLALLIGLRERPIFRFTCLDIGQGSCNLIEHRGHAYLFDAGSSSVSDVWRYRIGSTLKYYGIRRVDMVFLSHGDMDHINGLEQMLSLYDKDLSGKNASDVTIGEILLPRLPRQDARMDGIVSKALQQGIAVGCVEEGARFSEGGMELVILHPSPARLTGNANEDCIVMLVHLPGLRILLPGDLEKEGEERFVRDWREAGLFQEGEEGKGKTETVLLVAGHHGSRNATSLDMLEMINPDLVLISCGKNNRYGHPAREMLERLREKGISWRRTDKEGAICVMYG